MRHLRARQGLQCSHFYPRRHLAVRFDLRDCNAMCAGCNRRRNRDREPYEGYMLGRHGEILAAKKDVGVSYSRM